MLWIIHLKFIITYITTNLNIFYFPFFVLTGCSSKFCFTFNEGEISAEAGLCAVVSCSFSTDTNFTPPQAAVWFKCDPAKQKCSDNDIIFHSKNASKVQAGFLRRVFLLEPDLTQKNCSIIVNDLTVSDSGSYRIRMNVKREKPFGSDHKANVTIKGMKIYDKYTC